VERYCEFEAGDQGGIFERALKRRGMGVGLSSAVRTCSGAGA
jgi:hypothetical protein